MKKAIHRLQIRWIGIMVLKTEVLEPQYHAIVEVIARMKSNFGDSQSWAKELETILCIEDMIIYGN